LYQLIVFDQYGGRVFETNNSQQRWDGTCKGLPVIEGGYLYYLKITTNYNQTFELKGAVNVIFP
jgi:gliding motility-associated-like protein